MNIKVSLANDGAIVFASPVAGEFYDIAAGEAKMGLDYWADHLSRKNWFTPAVREQLNRVWNARRQ